jgi:hypothetical protein
MVNDHLDLLLLMTEYSTSPAVTQKKNIDPSIVTDLIQQRVNDIINESLCAPFSEKDISDALFQIGPLKAPGTDGFSGPFFVVQLGYIPP